MSNVNFPARLNVVDNAPSTMPRQLHRDISYNPSSGGLAHVRTAADAEGIQADVQRNLKLYCVAEALQNGQLPTNAQLDAGLAYVVQRARALPKRAQTRRVVSTFTKLLETVRLALKEKNADEMIQETLWMIHLESMDAIPPELEYAETADKGPRKGEFAEGAEHIRTLGIIFSTNSALRDCISHVIVKGKSATDVDEAEETEDGSTAYVDAESGGSSVTETAVAVPESVPAQPVVTRPAVEDAPNDPITSFFTSLFGGSDPVPDMGDGEMPGTYESDGDDYHSTAGNEEQLTRLEALERDPHLHDVLHRLRLALSSLQDTPGYGASMTWLLETFETYERETYLSDTPPDPSTPTRAILANIATLFERFACGRSLSALQNAIRKVYADAQADPDLMSLWIDVDMYLRRMLLDSSYTTSSESSAKGAELWERTKTWVRNGVYRAHWNLLFSSASYFLGFSEHEEEKTDLAWFGDDPVSQRLDETSTALLKELFLEHGRVVYKRDLWNELQRVLAPTVMGWGYMSIPRLELSGPVLDLVLENAHIAVANILPTFVTVQSRDAMTWSPFSEVRGVCEEATRQRVRVKMEQVQAEVCDALVFLRTKKVVRMEDAGIVDIVLSRKGISLTLDLDMDWRPRAKSILHVRDINISIDELSATVKECRSGRTGLYAFLLPLALPLLKLRLRTKWAEKLRLQLERLDEELLELRRRHERARVQADPERRREGAKLLMRVFAERMQDLRSLQESRRGSGNISGAGTGLARPVKKDPTKRFKISARLEDALLPEETYSKEESLVWRRWHVEEAARLAGKEAAGPGPEYEGERPRTTDVGLRLGRKRWRSIAFSMRQ